MNMNLKLILLVGFSAVIMGLPLSAAASMRSVYPGYPDYALSPSQQHSRTGDEIGTQNTNTEKLDVYPGYPDYAKAPSDRDNNNLMVTDQNNRKNIETYPGYPDYSSGSSSTR